MSENRLQDDLLKDYKEQRQFIDEQIALCDEMASSLQRRSTRNLSGKFTLIFLEVVFYVLFLASIAFAILMYQIYPFTILSELIYNPAYKQSSMLDITSLNMVIHAFPALIAVLFFIMARMTRSIRLKNNALIVFDRNMRMLTEHNLKRKAFIDTVEQRYFVELPVGGKTVNSIPNPGYDPNE